jgi:hypothetical protein
LNDDCYALFLKRDSSSNCKAILVAIVFAKAVHLAFIIKVTVEHTGYNALKKEMIEDLYA